MTDHERDARVNVKVLIILTLVIAAVGVSLIAARQLHREDLAAKTLAEAQAAFAQGNWSAAAEGFGTYLARHPDDLEVLRKYAEARLSIRPLQAINVSQAIAAYRRILDLTPDDETVCGKLVGLYKVIGNFGEIATLAGGRLDRDPDDRQASLWLAEALLKLDRPEEAREVLKTLIVRLGALSNKDTETYVQACALMSRAVTGEDPSASNGPGDDGDNAPSAPGQMVAQGDDASGPDSALHWLNRAVEYAPQSATALVHRARFHRQRAEGPNTDEEGKAALLARARQDLEAAEAIGTEAPRVHYSLALEWMAHGELDRATSEVEACREPSHKWLSEDSLDINDWKVVWFPLALDLARLKGEFVEGASLADDALASLTESGHRLQILPLAVGLYVAGARVADARRCLDEYLDLLPPGPNTPEAKIRVASLQAAVAEAEQRPYAVIDALQSVVTVSGVPPRLWWLLADAYVRTDQYGRAVNALNEYLLYQPQELQAVELLAQQYAKLGHWQKASETVGRLESAGSVSLSLRLLRLRADIELALRLAASARTQRMSGLIAELAQLREAHPGNADIRVLQSIVMASLGRLEEAEEELKRAIEECDEPLTAQMQLVELYAWGKRLDDAITLCSSVCQENVDRAQPWLRLADLHVANADCDAARACLDAGLATLTREEEKRSVAIKRAVAELDCGNRAAGIDRFRQMAAEDPEHIEARLLLLGTPEIQDDPNAAELLVEQLRLAEGESGLQWRLQRASLWLSSEQWRAKQQEIADLLRYCMDADPRWTAPALLLAEMYEKLGNIKRAEEIYGLALHANPAATDIANGLLTLLDEQGRFSDAERILEQIEPEFRVANFWGVRAALGAGDFDRAIERLQARVLNGDQDADSRIQLARLVYRQQQDAQQAFVYLGEAEAIDPDSRALTAAKASILSGEGRTAEALQVIDAYVADHNDFDAYLMRAEYLAGAGDLQRAEADYQKLLTFPEGGAASYARFANFYARTGRVNHAIELLVKGLEVYPGDLSLLRRRMELLFVRGGEEDRRWGLEILARLEEERPEDAALMTMRAAQILVDDGKALPQAREKLEQAVRIQPNAVGAHRALIQIAMQQGDLESASTYAVRALDANPGNPSLLLTRARVELGLGFTSMGSRLAQTVLARDPNNAEALSVVFESAVLGGRLDLLPGVRMQIDSAVARSPADEALLVLRAYVLTVLGEPMGAVPELEAYCRKHEGTCVKSLATLADLYLLGGNMEQSQSRIAEAEGVDAREAARARGQFRQMVRRSAQVLSTKESTEAKAEGVRLFEYAVTLSPESLDVKTNWALALYRNGDTERAKQAYQQVLQEEPDHVRALNDLAWVLQAHDHQYAAALELANRAVRLAPEEINILDTRGTILMNIPDRLADAKEDFATIVRLSAQDSPPLARAHLQMGRICERLGDLDEAKQHLTTALETDREIRVFTPEEQSEIRLTLEAESGQ